jgi:nucleoside-diphosphate-sugar epimerase
MKKALVCGAGGFIGSHLVKRLKSEGYWVRGVDLKYPEFSESVADEFMITDLRKLENVESSLLIGKDWKNEFESGFDEIYQLAADMGGAGYIFTGQHDADVMHNSATINLNVAHVAIKFKNKPKVFYSSSACIYPAYNQEDPENPKCTEDSAYPAAPDSEYGWEKLFSERLYLSFARNYGLNVRIARFHNIFGPEGTWRGGKEKAPAAMCRKVAEANSGESIEVWGDGKQTRSFLYVEECVEAVRRLMDSEFSGPVNVGSEEMISLNDFAKMVISISGKDLHVKNIEGKEFEEKYGFKCPVGVRGRNSDNTLIKEKIGWDYTQPLKQGMEETYIWIKRQVEKNHE